MAPARDTALVFATLGPPGSNHDWVARRYLEFHALSDARVDLFQDFDQAFHALLNGDAAHVIQAAVHPSATDSVARHRGRAHLVDTFLSASQPMAVLTRAEAAAPSTLGLQPATRAYVDVSPWKTLIPEPSTGARGAGTAGRTLRLGHHPGPVRRRAPRAPAPRQRRKARGFDAWLVYAREPTCTETLQAWPDTPAVRLFRRPR